MELSGEELAGLGSDLIWLSRHGAGAGICRVVRERRRQIEKYGYTLEHDQVSHLDDWLLCEAVQRTAVARYMLRHEPVPDVPSAMREAAESAALLAAEIDRLEAG